MPIAIPGYQSGTITSRMTPKLIDIDFYKHLISGGPLNDQHRIRAEAKNDL